jgi:Histidine kinase
MWKIIVFLGLSLCISGNLIAQAKINIDSLRKEFVHLEKNKPTFANDTNKVVVLEQIFAYHSMNTDSGLIYANKLLALAQKVNWKKGLAIAYFSHINLLMEKNPSKALEMCQKALAIGFEIKNEKIIAEGYFNIANIHNLKQNYPLAIKYYEKSNRYFIKTKDLFSVANNYNFIAGAWSGLGNKKNGLKFFQIELEFSRKNKGPNNKLELTEAFALSNMSDILIDSVGQKKVAIEMLKESNRLFAKLKRPMYLAEGKASIGQAYLANKDYKMALPYLIIGWNAYQKYNWTRGIDNDNLDKNLYETYKNLKQPSKALFYLERYYVMLDSALHSEYKTQRDIVKAQDDKEKQQIQIDKLKSNEIFQIQKLQQRTNNFLWAGLALLSLLGAVLLWYNRKLISKNKNLAEKNEIITDVTHKFQTTEIKALRAQMNPHFIFNCLNSIEYFNANNQPDKASEYLTKFSRLIRLVLENSRSEKVSLENELDTLRLYMDMEAMRFKGKIKYQININPNTEIEAIEIPPLLIQPFVENAIWHGLMHKDEGGEIIIDVIQVNENLLISKLLTTEWDVKRPLNTKANQPPKTNHSA